VSIIKALFGTICDLLLIMQLLRQSRSYDLTPDSGVVYREKKPTRSCE
jgi:hypothetical protein